MQTALTEARTFASRREIISASLLFAGVAAWGVVPALASVLSADEKMSFAANYLQVFFRLRHHLDPMDFKPAAYIGYTLLAVVAWLLHRQVRSGTVEAGAESAGAAEGAALSFFSKTIVCSGIIAGTGVLIGLGPRPPIEMPFYEFRMNLLKFYPFRLFDVTLPILVSIQVAMLLSERRLLCVLLPARSRTLIVGVCFCSAMYLNAGRGSIDRMTDAQRADWRDVCGWLKEHAPHDSLFLTPKESRTFRWFAERPEYVAFKDCPQDAAGIVEWNRRLRFLKKWGQDNWTGQSYSAAVTQKLHETTGITHIVSRRFGPFEVPVIYRNATFRVYQINAVQ